MSQYQARDRSYERPGVPDELKWAPVMRGYTTDTEVLTEVGWIAFRKLYQAGVNGLRDHSPLFLDEIDWKQEHKPLREHWQDNKSKHTLAYPFSKANTPDFTKWAVNSNFPRVATLTSNHMNPGVQDGTIEFVRPEYATRFNYENHQLVHLKKRGVDIIVPRYTDILTKSRFQKEWTWSVADDFCTIRNLPNAFKSVVNRYTPTGALFGDVDAETMLHLVETGHLRAMMTDENPAKIALNGKQANRVRIFNEYNQNQNVVMNSVECYNLTLPVGSSHTLIIRREGYTAGGEKPQTKWIGQPLIVGDGYDKKHIGMDRILGYYNTAA